MPQQNIKLPEADDVFQQFDQPETGPPSKVVAAPTPYQDMNWKQVMAEHAAQVPGGIADFAKGFSPVDVSQGYTHPRLQIPPALTGILQMVGHGFQGPTVTPDMIVHGQQRPPSDLGPLQSILQPYATLGREAGAALNIPGVQAPSGQEALQATRGATTNAAALAAPEAPKMVRTGATAAGIPQLLSETADSTLFKKAGGAPVVRAAARALYEPKIPKSKPGPINAEFVDKPAAPEGPIDVPYRPVNAPEPPPKMLKSYEQPKVAEGPTPPKQLSGAQPGDRIFTGQEGGIPPQPHADVVGQRPMIVRTVKGDGSGAVPGQMRLETPKEMRGRLTNFGRSLTSQPGADAEPYVAPKPTPPKRSVKK